MEFSVTASPFIDKGNKVVTLSTLYGVANEAKQTKKQDKSNVKSSKGKAKMNV